jgi:hypothetical protein
MLGLIAIAAAILAVVSFVMVSNVREKIGLYSEKKRRDSTGSRPPVPRRSAPVR